MKRYGSRARYLRWVIAACCLLSLWVPRLVPSQGTDTVREIVGEVSGVRIVTQTENDFSILCADLFFEYLGRELISSSSEVSPPLGIPEADTEQIASTLARLRSDYKNLRLSSIALEDCYIELYDLSEPSQTAHLGNPDALILKAVQRELGNGYFAKMRFQGIDSESRPTSFALVAYGNDSTSKLRSGIFASELRLTSGSAADRALLQAGQIPALPDAEMRGDSPATSQLPFRHWPTVFALLGVSVLSLALIFWWRR